LRIWRPAVLAAAEHGDEAEGAQRAPVSVEFLFLLSFLQAERPLIFYFIFISGTDTKIKTMRQSQKRTTIESKKSWYRGKRKLILLATREEAPVPVVDEVGHKHRAHIL
jgi:hypothetical protein